MPASTRGKIFFKKQRVTGSIKWSYPYNGNMCKVLYSSVSPAGYMRNDNKARLEVRDLVESDMYRCVQNEYKIFGSHVDATTNSCTIHKQDYFVIMIKIIKKKIIFIMKKKKIINKYTLQWHFPSHRRSIDIFCTSVFRNVMAGRL